MKKTLYIALTAALIVVTACSDNDLDSESMFDTDVPVYDESAATYPFDKWIYETFTVPFNVDIQYRFNFPASSLDYQLVPAEYKHSQMLAHLIKYLFYDVYASQPADLKNPDNGEVFGDEFMKIYGPRIFHFIGSAGINPTNNNETLGTASGGVKITLYKVNKMKLYEEGKLYDIGDIDSLNNNYFHTMHHEFSHILHQTKTYPVNFGQVTSGGYEPFKWQERDSTETHKLGFVTNYGSSATYEDFVETLSSIITDSDHRWMMRIISGCLDGLRKGDKELVTKLIEEQLKIEDLDDPTKTWNKFELYGVLDEDYNQTGKWVLNLDGYRDKGSYGKDKKYFGRKQFTSFRKFLDEFVEETNEDNVAGMSAMLKKIDIANTWYNEQWGLDAFLVRQEVGRRQKRINEFFKNEMTIYDLQ